MIVRQLSVGGFDSNFSYIIHDPESGNTAVVDPCGDISLIVSELEKFQDLRAKYILLTHGHGDHTSGVTEIKSLFNAKVVAHKNCLYPHEIDIQDHQKLPFGKLSIECLYAPGHSIDGVIYRLSNDTAIFTGDTLFIDCCGYCDAATMFRTMRKVIYPLADSNEVYSGHNYGHAAHAPLGDEKETNPYLAAGTYEDFCEALENL